MKVRPRVVFFGSPEFAVPSLAKLLEIADVALVVTQPDRPAGRGLTLRKPPVKVHAEARDVPVIQPTKVKTAEFAARIAAAEADVGVVVAYGRILPPRVLEAPRLGCVNVHWSLLPRWRGAAPIQWAIASGDSETGVCLMKMDEGLDTGPVIASLTTAIDPAETAGELAVRLAALGAEILERNLVAYVAGDLIPIAQPAAGATYAPLLERTHGKICWGESAARIHDLVRGMNPWPSASASVGGRRVRIHRTAIVDLECASSKAGAILRADRTGLHVACGKGTLSLLELQLDGKRQLPAAEFLLGANLQVGMRMEEEP